MTADRSEGNGEHPRVEVSLLGAFRVLRDGHDVTPSGLSGQLLRLVALRAVPVHVDDCAEELWPRAPMDRGRRRMRNVLARLRDACGDVLERRGECLLLARHVQVDLHVVADAAERALAGLREGRPGAAAAARAALGVAHLELLPEDRYAPWAAEARGRHERRVVALLDRLADAAASAGDGREAVRLLLEAIDLEPYDEDRYARAAILLAGDGRRGLAANLLDVATMMLDDLGVAPSGALRRLRSSLAEPAEIHLDEGVPRRA